MEGKTPVSALQEHLIRIKRVPAYELVENGTGTCNPEFVYRVHVNDLSADGKGKSKQEAKHRAADNMLKALNLREEGGLQSPIPDCAIDFNENFVGQLKEYCLLQPYPEPVYKVEEEAGPPHSKTFKVDCCVSQLHEYGIAKKKKAAKQLAAYYMIERLKKLSKTKCVPAVSQKIEIPPGKTLTEMPSMPLKSESNANKYNNLKSATQVIQKDRFVYYKDHHKAYTNLPESSETLSKIIQDNSLVTTKNAMNLANKIVEELGANLKSVEGEVITGKKLTLVGMESRENEWPNLAGMGETEALAAVNILNSLIILASE